MAAFLGHIALAAVVIGLCYLVVLVCWVLTMAAFKEFDIALPWKKEKEEATNGEK